MRPLSSNPVAELWAARITDGYAARARPEMSDRARAVLQGHLARWLAAVVPDAPVGNWPDPANVALDTWEVEVRTKGPRVRAFDKVAEAVRFRETE